MTCTILSRLHLPRLRRVYQSRKIEQSSKSISGSQPKQAPTEPEPSAQPDSPEQLDHIRPTSPQPDAVAAGLRAVVSSPAGLFTLYNQPPPCSLCPHRRLKICPRHRHRPCPAHSGAVRGSIGVANPILLSPGTNFERHAGPARHTRIVESRLEFVRGSCPLR